jgi:hypothetical protein
MQGRSIAAIALSAAMCLPLFRHGEAAFPLPKEHKVLLPNLRTVQSVPSYTLGVSIAYGSGNCWANINFKPYGSTISGVPTGLAGAGRLNCYLNNTRSYSSNNTFLIIPTGASSFSVNIIAAGEPSWTGSVTTSGGDLRGTVGPSGTEYRIQIGVPPPAAPPLPPPPVPQCVTQQGYCWLGVLGYIAPGTDCHCGQYNGKVSR